MFRWLGNLTDSNERELKKLKPLIERINGLESAFKSLNDAELLAKTQEFKERLAKGETLDALLLEAFAAVREASKRTIKLRHFDVQLMGGIVLHQGKIAEMKTGEGKTLVATLPLYLNSLTGKGCHLATVNDYLARRDPYWMGPVFSALGVTVSSIYPQTPEEHSPARLYDPNFDSGDATWRHFKPVSRKEAYQADITYGTSSEFGFDYLRDNMVVDLAQAVQREPNYAIVDEVDYLLIDEARTPLIISGAREESPKEYEAIARFAQELENGSDYKMEEKGKGVAEISDAGFDKAERLLQRAAILTAGSLFDMQNAHLLHHLRNAITAKEAYHRDKEYVVKDGEVIIVDEFTGRLMLGRRYEGGLHQAIEAKEHVPIQKESLTYATITIQNYFRMYPKLGGMTGTAVTESEEFSKIYKLEVVVIPTNMPMLREDLQDQVYKNEKGKFRAVVTEIEKIHKEERPILIGTTSIETSEKLSDLLTRNGVRHEVLNAKQHEKEAQIIAQAGRPGAVTVATNMAGRGVDIILGGKPFRENLQGEPDGQDEKEWQALHDKVVSLGGLHVIGTERHEARRIDNQLRGRAGRQGDPGSSRFYVSLEDDIMRRFGGDRLKGVMEWAGMTEDMAIENTLVNKSIENAQIKVEGYNFDIRKHLVDYDDVVSKQREIIYGERRKVLSGADLRANIISMLGSEIHNLIESNLSGLEPDYAGLHKAVLAIMPLPPEMSAEALGKLKPTQIEDELDKYTDALYASYEEKMGADNMRVLERLIMLRTIDSLWIEHLTAMEDMRQGIGLEAIGQRDPLVVYKTRGHEMFQNLMAGIQEGVTRTIFHVTIRRDSSRGLAPKEKRPPPSPMAKVAANRPANVARQPVRVAGKKVGRNDPCPCGSGKKYKHCCGR
ncbi:MAG: preprotein translocase subunit SecA [Chloroflexota bacterium]